MSNFINFSDTTQEILFYISSDILSTEGTIKNINRQSLRMNINFYEQNIYSKYYTYADRYYNIIHGIKRYIK